MTAPDPVNTGYGYPTSPQYVTWWQLGCLRGQPRINACDPAGDYDPIANTPFAYMAQPANNYSPTQSGLQSGPTPFDPSEQVSSQNVDSEA